MLSIATGTKIFLAAEPTDMRKGFNALQGLVTGKLEKDPLSGHLFLFINRRRDKLKILYWDMRLPLLTLLMLLEWQPRISEIRGC